MDKQLKHTQKHDDDEATASKNSNMRSGQARRITSFISKFSHLISIAYISTTYSSTNRNRSDL